MLVVLIKDNSIFILELSIHYQALCRFVYPCYASFLKIKRVTERCDTKSVICRDMAHVIHLIDNTGKPR